MSIFHMGTGYRLPFGATVIPGVFGACSGFGVGWRAAGWGAQFLYSGIIFQVLEKISFCWMDWAVGNGSTNYSISQS